MKPMPILLFTVLILCGKSSALISTPMPSQLVVESADILVGRIAWDVEKGLYMDVERNVNAPSSPRAIITVNDRERFGSLSSSNALARLRGDRAVVFGQLLNGELVTDFYEYSVWPNMTSPSYGVTTASLGEDMVRIIKRYEEIRRTKGNAFLLECLDSDLNSDQKRWAALDYVGFCISYRSPLETDADKAFFESFVDVCATKMGILRWNDDASCWQLMNLVSHLSAPLRILVLESISSSGNSISSEAAEQLQGEMKCWKDIEKRLGRTFIRHPYSRFSASQCLETLQSDSPVIHDNAPFVLQAILGLDDVPEESRFDPTFWKAKIEELP